jgi:hypothetical protein
MDLVARGLYWIYNYPPFTYTFGMFLSITLIPFTISVIALFPVILLIGFVCGEPDWNEPISVTNISQRKAA